MLDMFLDVIVVFIYLNVDIGGCVLICCIDDYVVCCGDVWCIKVFVLFG